MKHNHNHQPQQVLCSKPFFLLFAYYHQDLPRVFYFEDRLDALWNLCYWLPAVLLCSKIDWVHRFCHSTEELFLGSFWKSVANSMESQALFRVAVHFYGSMSQLEHEVTVSQGYLMPTEPTLHWKTIKRYLKFGIVPCQNKMVVKGSCWSQNKMWKDSKTGKQYLAMIALFYCTTIMCK